MTGLVVTQVVEDGEHTVTLALDARTFLPQLADAIRRGSVIGAWLTVAGERDVEIREHALNRLLAIPAVREALTLTMTPALADRLAEDVLRATAEPARCESCHNTLVPAGVLVCGRCDDAQDSLDNRIRSAWGA